MVSAERNAIRERVLSRSSEIANRWFNGAIHDPELRNHADSEIKVLMEEIVKEAIELLTSETFGPSRARELGERIAKTRPGTAGFMGRTQEILSFEMTKDVPENELRSFYNDLSSFMANFTIGYIHHARKTFIEEQKSIQDKLMEDLILVDEKLRKTNEELEAKVLERTSELQKLNEELKHEVDIRMKAEEGLKKREHLLSMAFDTSFLWTGLLDHEGRLLLANKQSLNFLDLKRDDVIGKYFWDTPWWAHSGKQREKVQKAIREARKGTAAKFDVYHIDKEENRQDVQFSIRPVKNERGEVIYLIPEGVNITERKDHERVLERARDEFKSLLEGTRDMYFSIDDQGTLTYIGPQISKFGHSQEDVIGKNLSSLMTMLHPDDLEESEKTFIKRFTELDESPRSYRFVGPNNEVYWVEETVKIIKDDNGKMVSLNGIIRDISERKKVEEELLNLNEVLRLINQIMRHDISNRLLVAHGNIGLIMENGSFDPDKVKAIENAIRSSVELTKRMAELENLVHGSDGMKELDLAQVINPIFDEHPVEHTIIGNAKVKADDALTSVFTNLISNAISHGNAKKVEFRIEETNDHCIITVNNDGTPIPEGARNMVFDESFSFGDNRGSGLGLFISKRLIERYGGSIELVDTDDNETVFQIRLPRASI